MKDNVLVPSYLDLWLPSTLICENINPNILKTLGRQDLLAQLVKNELGETESKSRNAVISTMHENCKEDISQMIIAGNYLQASENITNVLNQKRTDETIDDLYYQLLFTRIAIFLKLREIKFIEEEIEIIFAHEKQSPELEPNTDGNNQGTMLVHSNIPFSLRILYAIFPAFKKEYEIALQRITLLYKNTIDVLKRLSSAAFKDASAIAIWKERQITVKFNLVTCLLLNHDYESAFDALEGILRSGSSYLINANYKFSLTLYLVRLLIQFGNLSLAQNILAALESNPNVSPENSDDLRLHRGYILLMLNEYQEAKLQFETCYQHNPLNKPIAINNLALVLLYSGKLKDAIELLEREIELDPATMLHECIIYNLSSLYELRSSNNIYHKRLLLQKVARVKGDGFISECFKLT